MVAPYSGMLVSHKKGWSLIHVTTGMNLENLTPSGRSHTLYDLMD